MEVEGAAAAEWADPATLVPWEKNPRVNEAAIGPVADSIKLYGFGSPILARREDRMVIAGHTRRSAAMRLGMPLVPVRFLDVTRKEAEKLALVDNKVGEIAAWDHKLLADLAGDGLDLASLGWTEVELGTLGDIAAETRGWTDGVADPVEPAPRSHFVTLAVRVEQVDVIEAAIEAAMVKGSTRGDALMRICSEWQR